MVNSNNNLNQQWRTTFLIFAAAFLLLLGLYHESLLSMISIWKRSDTFTHGFLIFPVSAYLVWRRRKILANLVPAPDKWALLPLAIVGICWLLARLAGVLGVEQFSFVAMIPLLCWAILGGRVSWEIAFPLGFLFFAVPFGEFLIPRMMNFTADFTVAMLKLTGIPVYREGTFFSIPSGDWSVVEGCSGLRYLISSITLGVLYAYLNYRSIGRRLAFSALACTFPVIANGLRAYMIVMIAHLSDMKLALGVDHYIYGWVFFGLVMLLMFWIGSFWTQDDETEQLESSANWRDLPNTANFNFIAVLAVSIAAFWPIRAMQIDAQAAARNTPVTLTTPSPIAPWTQTEDFTTWEPRYIGPDVKQKATYSDGTHKIAVYLMYYRSQSQDHELINSQNVLIQQKHPEWRMPEEKAVTVTLGGANTNILQGRVLSTQQNLLTWRWNWVSGGYTINDYVAKMQEARDKFFGSIQDGAGIILAIDYGGDQPGAARALQDFVNVMLPSVETSLKLAAGSAAL